MPDRKEMFDSIKAKLNNQCFDLGVFCNEVEICSHNSNVLTTGAKRNALLEMSRGKFIVFVDDDDDVSDDYVEKIFFTILKHPYIDCIGIEGIITTDGEQQKDWIISIDCKDWYEENDVYLIPVPYWVDTCVVDPDDPEGDMICNPSTSKSLRYARIYDFVKERLKEYFAIIMPSDKNKQGGIEIKEYVPEDDFDRWDSDSEEY
jgi:glycosyltransferase involved in cell wall biosynthesis